MKQAMIPENVIVTKSRKGWQVSTINGEGAVTHMCWFSDRTQAYAYAYALEHGL